MFLRTHYLLLLVSGGALELGFAQSPPPTARTRADRGFYPTGTFSVTALDTINDVNGNLMLSVPLASLPPGRGGSIFALRLIYNSALYDTTQSLDTRAGTGGTQNVVKYTLQPAPRGGGWRYSYQFGLDHEVRQAPGGGSCFNDPADWRVHKMYLHSPDGALHTLRLFGRQDVNGDGYYSVSPNKQTGPCTPPSEVPPSGDLVYYTDDSSFIRVEIGSTILPGCTINPTANDYWKCRLWRAFLPDGTELHGFGNKGTKIIDRNLNEITISEYVDGNGHTVTLISDALGRFIEVEHILNETPVRDVVRTEAVGRPTNRLEWNVEWTTPTVAWNEPMPPNGTQHPGFAYVCIADTTRSERKCSTSGLSAPLSVRKITVPTQLVSNRPEYAFEFTYSGIGDGGWGEIKTVRFPARFSTAGGPQSRATVTYYYKHESYPHLYESPGGTLPLPGMRDITQQLENPVIKKELKYTEAGGGSGSTTETTLYSFGDMISTTTLHGGAGTITRLYDSVFTPWDWRRGLVKQINEPLGRVTTRTWVRNWPFAGPNTPVSDGNAANVFVQRESVTQDGLTQTRDFAYDRNGNLMSLVERDWGGVGAAVLRTTTHTYQYPAGSPDANINSISPDANGYWNQISAPRWFQARASTKVSGSSGTVAFKQFVYDTAVRNVIREWAWNSDSPGSPPTSLTASNAISTQTAYDTFGNVTTTIDPRLIQTVLTYGAVNNCSPITSTASNLYPTTRNIASSARIFNLEYDCVSGLVTTETDTQNGVSTVMTYDAIGRLKTRTEAGLRSEVRDYHDAEYTTTLKRDLDILPGGGTRMLTVVNRYDDLGRLYRSQSTDDTGAAPTLTDTTAGVIVDYRYREWIAGFREEAVSNPYRASESVGRGWTRTKFDALDRVVEVVQVDGDSPFGSGATTSTVYSGNTITVTDPAGKKRTSVMDGLGRLVQVIEDPGTSGNKNWSTTYTYDAADNLLSVTQGSQTRSFEYSTLSRLRQANNPESGLTKYTYDESGNLLTREDARGVKVTFGAYDTLNRPVSKSYNDTPRTPTVTFGYDNCTFGRGRLCSADNGLSVSSYGYNALGQVVSKSQTTAGKAYSSSYTYNLADGVTSMNYQQGTQAPKLVSYGYTNAGRVSQICKGPLTPCTPYVSGVAYWPHGAEKTLTLGNGLVEQTVVNGRLQMESRTATKHTTQHWAIGLGYGSAASNNGNPATQTITHGSASPIVQTYTYDPVNRLKRVVDPLGNQTFVYDRFGNRALLSSEGYQPVEFAQGIKVSSDTEAAVEAMFPGNKMVGATHDVAGNITTLESRNLEYDGEGRVRKVSKASGTAESWTYEYDGEGRRVRQVHTTGSGTSEVNDDTHYVYDAAGQLLADYAVLGTNLIGAEGLRYVTSDWLGSTRLVTDSAGAVVSRHDYLPFGEEVRTTGGAGPRERFTGKERENYANIGLDYFGARYMSAAQGRFTSPDAPFADQRPTDPQSWNLYSYTRNNPLVHVDPTGRGAVRAGVKAAARTLEQKLFDAARSQGVRRAWKQEVELVRATGQGSREWTESQVKELMTHGKVKGFVGHHINSVKGNDLASAANPNNIKFVEGQAGNLAEHGGDFRNQTSGPLIDRLAKLGGPGLLAFFATFDQKMNEYASQSPIISNPDSWWSNINPVNNLVENAALLEAWAAADAADREAKKREEEERKKQGGN